MSETKTVLALAVLLALAAWPAAAQDKSQLDTVTITAERRTENIMDVPNAVTALTGEKLDVLASGGQDVRFLSGRVPSLNIESSFGRAFPRFYIRGYGNSDFRLNASQPVSLIYDDVVQETPILKGFPVFDLKSIEVIDGPQGTLFGRNTPAGVVKFDSVPPSKRNEGYVSLAYGTYGTSTVEGAFNLPLGGDWAARVSAQIQHRDDWVHNTQSTGTQKTEGYDDRAVRVQALYAPNRDFSALFNVHNRELDGSPRLFRANIIKPGTNDLVDGFDPARMSIDGTNTQRLHATGGSVRLKWNFGEALTLHSITGIETVQPFSRGDVDGGYGDVTHPPMGPGFIPFASETSDALRGHRQLTQELRLESNAAGPLRWQAGVFLFDDKFTIESMDYVAPLTTSTHQTNKAMAVFGSVNYELSANLKLRGGLRYTKDKKDLSSWTTDATRFDASAGTSASTDDSKWNWDASATYQLAKGTNVYARVATGFRASSIQPAGPFNPQSMAGPEDVRSFEIGVKSEFWERRARVSAALYDFEVRDQQLTAVGGGANANRLINAKKAQGQGFELNLELLPVDQLLVTLGGSYNKTKLKDPGLQVDACGNGCTLRDPVTAPADPANFKFAPTVSIDGNALPNAPKWVGNLTARYSIPTASGGEFYVYTDWSYRSSVSFFLYDSVEGTGKALTEGGLRLGYIWGRGQYEAAVFGRNITNQIRVTGGIDFNNFTGFINDPRTWGVQFKALF